MLESKGTATFFSAFDSLMKPYEASLEDLAPPARVFSSLVIKLLVIAKAKSESWNFVPSLEDSAIVYKKQLKNFLYLVVT